MKKPTKISQFDPNLVLWLRMQEGPNNVAFDYSGAGNHCSISGATWNNPGLNFIKTNTLTTIQAITLTKFTLAMWIYRIGDQLFYTRILDTTNGHYQPNSYQVYFYSNDNTLGGYLRGDGASTGDVTSGWVIPDSVWAHIGVIYDTNNMLFYGNGDLKANPAYTLGGTWNSSIQIGDINTVAIMDDIHLWNTDSSLKLIQHYQSTRSKYGV